MESTATWSVRRLPAPEPRPRHSPAPGACWTVAAALLLICGQLLLHCEAALQPRTVSSSATLLVPVTARALPATNALQTSLQARGKDDYDYDDDDYDDDYDYYGTRKKKKKKPAAGTQAAALSPSETNVFNFVRIMVLRLVWGFASWFGWEEPLSEAFGGAFVPPGVDPDGDDDLGFDY